MAAEDVDELVADDFDDLLGGREGGEDFLAHGLRLDGLDELLDDLEVDVGLQQRHADLAQRRLDVGFAQRAAAAQAVEHPCQAIAKALKHLHSETA